MIENLPREALLVGGSIGAAALVTYLTRFRPRWPTGPLGKKPGGLQRIGDADFHQKRGSGKHEAVDIGMPVGTPIRALASGRVNFVAYDHSSAGTYIEIDHRSALARLLGLPGYYSRYLHLSQPTPSNPTVEVGDFVFKGQKIGLSGGEPGAYGAGNTTGPHLHLEVLKGSRKLGTTAFGLKRVNPEWYLPGFRGYLRKTLIAGSIFGVAYFAAKKTGVLK